VASRDVAAGELILRVPDNLMVTLDRVFEDGAVAELLTTSKLSELACLTLYLCYEKKRGGESFYAPFIQELDKQGGRGPQGAKSPLLWRPDQVDEWLAGSPVVGQVRERLRGIQREYEELDTVWFMAGSLFKNYPFEPPTEQFSLETFTQAFAAVQSCVVHLQGVPLSKRFALLPLGPPLLAYSSTAKAVLRYDAGAGEVRLEADRAYAAGEPVVAWCGPQPNSRLLLNYGVVDDDNPYDKLPLTGERGRGKQREERGKGRGRGGKEAGLVSMGGQQQRRCLCALSGLCGRGDRCLGCGERGGAACAAAPHPEPTSSPLLRALRPGLWRV
jgi:histone-lysine N-methyltransferase SETD3